MYKLKISLLFLMITTSFITYGYADEVVNIINDALQQYKNEDYTEAASNLDYASQLIRQKKSEKLQSFLPKPLDGWVAEDVTTQAIGTAMLIGGTSAKRKYSKDSSVVTIEIIADSPLLQSVMMLFNTPLIATVGGGKLERIKGQNAIVTYRPADQQGEIKIILAGRILVNLNGTDVSKQTLIAYSNKIDYKKIATFH